MKKWIQTTKTNWIFDKKWTIGFKILIKKPQVIEKFKNYNDSINITSEYPIWQVFDCCKQSLKRLFSYNLKLKFLVVWFKKEQSNLFFSFQHLLSINWSVFGICFVYRAVYINLIRIDIFKWQPIMHFYSIQKD